jgi:hypothetical protein
MSASLSRRRFYLGDPEGACAAYIYTIAAKVAFPGSVCQFRANEHHFFRALRDAGFAKVAFCIVHVIGTLIVLFYCLGGANCCTVAALGANPDAIDAGSGEMGLNDQCRLLGVVLVEQVQRARNPAGITSGTLGIIHIQPHKQLLSM